MSQAPTVTADQVKTLVAESFESNVPDTILEALKPFAGKNITVRLEKAVQAALPKFNVRMVRNYGWTDIKWESPERNPKTNDPMIYGSFMLARSEASVPLDLDWVVKENPAYFSARNERNAERTLLVANRDWQDRVAAAINQLNAALENAVAVINEGDAVRYELQRTFLDKDLQKISLYRS